MDLQLRGSYTGVRYREVAPPYLDLQTLKIPKVWFSTRWTFPVYEQFLLLSTTFPTQRIKDLDRRTKR